MLDNSLTLPGKIGLIEMVQVIWEVGRLLLREGEQALNWIKLGGLLTGTAIMYFTAFFVKF